MRGVNLWREKTDLRRQKGCGEASCPNQDAGQPRQAMSAVKACPAAARLLSHKTSWGRMGRPDAGRKGHASKNRLSRPGLPKDRP